MLEIGEASVDTAPACLSLWVSKYLYDGDISKISFHNEVVLGASPLVAIPLGILFGLFFDKWGELVVLPLMFFLAGAPYAGLFFL